MEKYRNKVTGEIHEGSWTTEHAASSYNQPVLIIDGQAVDHVWWERSDNPAAVLGRKGGSRNTDTQRKARAANGAKGGRPRVKGELDATLHRDGTVTYWSVYEQRWVKRGESISLDDLAAMSREERERVMRHLGMD